MTQGQDLAPGLVEPHTIGPSIQPVQMVTGHEWLRHGWATDRHPGHERDGFVQSMFFEE